MIKRVAIFLLLVGITGFAFAQAAPQHWVLNKNYFAIPRAQAAPPSDKVVVTEVFSFACPACNQAVTFIDKIREELPKGAVLEYLPAGFIPTEDWPVFQRAYFTAKALGVDTPTSHDAMFKAVWGPNGQLATYDSSTQRPKPMKEMPTIEDIAKFYAKYGAKPADFVATANSFAVNMDIKRADKQIVAWGVDSTPTMIIDGKWRFNAQSAGGLQQMVDLTLYLAQQELAAKAK